MNIKESYNSYLDEVKLSHLCLLVGGSHLYGLSNDNSDVDFRGVYLLNSLDEIYGTRVMGKRSYENYTVITDKFDASLFDLRKFIYLLEKTNTQVAEILFADETDFLILSSDFKYLTEHRTKLINSSKLYTSIRGFIQGERRLMNGERTGQLGGKRKKALETYGYSYKNLVQILRLAYCASTFFNEGYYPVNIKRDNLNLWESLMSIKEHPETFTLKQAESMVDEADNHIVKSFDNRSIDYKFDKDFAEDFISFTYGLKIRELFDKRYGID